MHSLPDGNDSAKPDGTNLWLSSCQLEKLHRLASAIASFRTVELAWNRYDTGGHIFLSIQGQGFACSHDREIQNYQVCCCLPASESSPASSKPFSDRAIQISVCTDVQHEPSALLLITKYPVRCSSAIGSLHHRTAPFSSLHTVKDTLHFPLYTLYAGKSHSSPSKTPTIPTTSPVLHGVSLYTHCCSSLPYIQWAVGCGCVSTPSVFSLCPVDVLVSLVHNQARHPLLCRKRCLMLLLNCPLLKVLNLFQSLLKNGVLRKKNITCTRFNFQSTVVIRKPSSIFYPLFLTSTFGAPRNGIPKPFRRSRLVLIHNPRRSPWVAFIATHSAPLARSHVFSHIYQISWSLKGTAVQWKCLTQIACRKKESGVIELLQGFITKVGGRKQLRIQLWGTTFINLGLTL